MGVVVEEQGASTNPVEGNEGPGKREGKSGGVDEDGRAWVAEVAKREVEEVDDDQEESDPEVAADPEVDKSEDEEVRCDEMGRNVAGSGKVELGGGLVEGEEVVHLEDEDDDPVYARDDAILGKCSWKVVAPDSPVVDQVSASTMVVVMVFWRSVESVIDGGEEEDQVGEGGGDLVNENRLAGVCVSAGKWVETATA